MTREQIQDLLTDALKEKYQVLGWIGGGGMAEVFLAKHRIHGALFAVKVLSIELARDERIVARFVQEARTAATLSGHPNIVPVFDIEEANGLYFLLMQYVDGEDLAKYLKAHKRLRPNDAAKIVCQVADALAWAAAKGVVHRDVKPSNLYLDQNGRIMVLDFGIAKAADVPINFTSANERVGTTYYMSPEQIRGEHCDQRSDLYSLGVVFFELLAGRKPFDGDSYRSVEAAHLEAPPPNLHELDRTIPKELSIIVETLLQKEPDRRYQSARELVDDLNRYGAGMMPLGLRPRARGDETEIKPGNSLGTTGISAVRPGVTPNGAHVPQVPAAAQSRIPRALAVALAMSAALVLTIAGYLFYKRFVPTTKVGPATAEKSFPPTISDRLGGRLRLVPAGTFIFGSDDPESPSGGKETLNLPAFYIDENEVTAADYHKYLDETGQKEPEEDEYAKHPDFPATNVSYEDAERYASWIGKRLPSEKEWEKAARGNDGRTYPWGNEEWKQAPRNLHAVHSFANKVSPYGAYNMAANVFEWTTSHFQVDKQYLDDMKKSLGTSKFSHDWRIIKGGHFGTGTETELFWRSYMRRGFPKDKGSPVIGFRCVMDPK